jgi:hypothetical protein
MFELNHYNVSMVKSGLRILAGGFLMCSSFFVAGGLFIVAEVLGIVEEIVEDK